MTRILIDLVLHKTSNTELDGLHRKTPHWVPLLSVTNSNLGLSWVQTRPNWIGQKRRKSCQSLTVQSLVETHVGENSRRWAVSEIQPKKRQTVCYHHSCHNQSHSDHTFFCFFDVWHEHCLMLLTWDCRILWPALLPHDWWICLLRAM